MSVLFCRISICKFFLHLIFLDFLLFVMFMQDKMVQCAEAHLFCRDCVSQYASTKLGEHNHLINCMHESGCKEPFPISELRRILSPKLMDLYERVKQQKEIEAAGLEGLEECPFCEWKCVLEVSNEEDKLFRCGNEEGGCGVVSCRMCKKKVRFYGVWMEL